jgi:uncharacterized membrane protein HdeD (DUF308 family)
MEKGEGERRRPLLIVTGAVAIGLGLVAVLVPAVASVGMAIFVGIVLLTAGAALALHALAVGGAGHKLLWGAAALGTLAAGLSLLVTPLDGTFTLTVILVIWLCGFGVVQMLAGAIAAGASSVVLGILIAVGLPSSADWVIGLLIGIDLIVYGALCLVRAFRG